MQTQCSESRIEFHGLGERVLTADFDGGNIVSDGGVPLVAEQGEHDGGQIEDIWFSDIQEIPGHIKLVELLGLIQAQLCRCKAASH